MRLTDWLALAPVFMKCIGKLPAAHLAYLAGQFAGENPHRHNGRLYVNTFFPPIPSPAFDRFISALIERRRTPHSVYFAVTNRCPYKCPHCSYGNHVSGCLDEAGALDAVEQIKALGAATIGFTGGEPLLREDLPELVRAASNTCATILFTTGFSLDEDKARQLADSGLGCMMVGVESDDAAEHNAVRGTDDSFEIALQAIELSQEAGLYTAISTVATRDKLQNGTLPRLAEMAERLGVLEFRILEPVPTGGYRSESDAVLSEGESAGITAFHKQWNLRGKGPAICAFSHLESGEMFGCGAGYHHLYIDAAGNVCPCDLTPLSFGNLSEKPLAEIWRELGELFALPRRGCLMKEICKSSCCLSEAKAFPLSPMQSREICAGISKTALPEVYKRLLK